MGIAMLGLFNLKSFYANAGIFTKSLYTCWPAAWTELECYNDSTGLSGYTGVLSSAECCGFCNSRKSTCAITKSGKTDHFTETDFGKNGADSFSTTQDVLECASASNNFVGACPNTALYNGNPCTVRKVLRTDENKILYDDSNNYWDATNKQCVSCGWWEDTGGDNLIRNNVALNKCGDTSGVYLDNTGTCNGWSLGGQSFSVLCGADTACDGKSYPSGGPAPNCTGGTCDLDGKCVASVLSITTDKTSITTNTPTNIVVTITYGGSSVNAASVSISGVGIDTSISCTTNSSGQCTLYNVTATSTGNATVKAKKSGYTDGSKIISAVCPGGCTVGDFQCNAGTPQNCNFVSGCGKWEDTTKVTEDTSVFCGDGKDNDCSGKKDGLDPNCQFQTCMLWPNETIYKKGEPINVFYANVDCGAGSIDVKDSGNNPKATGSGVAPGSCRSLCTNYPPDCGYIMYDIKSTDSTGIWKSNLDAPVTGCTNSISFSVIECTSSADCGGNPCDANGNCVAALPPTCSSTSCGAAIATVPCMCGAQKVTTAGSYCCAADDVYDTYANCSKSSGSCSVACVPTGPEGIAYGNCSDGKDNDCANGADGADSNCVVAPFCGDKICNGIETGVKGDLNYCSDCPPPPCSGPKFYRSPLNYCTIQELLEASTGWILGLVSSIIILILIIGGIMYVSSAGNEERIRTAKNVIYYAVIGLAIILLSYSMIAEIKIILKIP